jgi:hypothetical protein
MCLLRSTIWGFIFQDTAFFIVISVKTSDLTYSCIIFTVKILSLGTLWTNGLSIYPSSSRCSTKRFPICLFKDSISLCILEQIKPKCYMRPKMPTPHLLQDLITKRIETLRSHTSLLHAYVCAVIWRYNFVIVFTYTGRHCRQQFPCLVCTEPQVG